MTLSAYVGGIGVLGPGLANWEQTASVLTGRMVYTPARTVLLTPMLLPPAERRRTGRVVKLALAVALEATTHAGINPAQLASVFSSSGGDGDNCHELCQALAQESREISPTRFANSVHNAAAGYWSIATGAKRESNVLCAFDASFGAGLLESLTQVTVDGESVLLVAYDTEYPEPIHAVRPVPDAFGVALVITPHEGAGSLARIELTLEDDPADTLSDALLETMRGSIPAARALPLLRQLASRTTGRIVLDYLDVSRIVVRVTPCG
jgi:Beta-ketoacyl synthase, N-terminal domain